MLLAGEDSDIWLSWHSLLLRKNNCFAMLGTDAK